MKKYNAILLTVIAIAVIFQVYDDHVWNVHVIRYRAYDTDEHKFIRPDSFPDTTLINHSEIPDSAAYRAADFPVGGV